MKRRALALAALALPALALPPAAWSLPSDEEIRQLLVTRVDKAKQATAVVVGIVTPGQRRVISYCALGPGQSRTPDGDTVFEIGSVTKVITALLLADMARRGEVALDDPVARYLVCSSPPCRYMARLRHGNMPITLMDLATHTSGLPNMPSNFQPRDWSNPHADYTIEQLYEFLSRYEPPNDAETKYIYSNLGVGLLGHALSRRAKQNFDALVRSRITQPLGMRDTRSAPTQDMTRRLVSGHDSKLSRTASWQTPTLAGAGGLLSTADDLMTLLEVFLGLKPSPLQATTRTMIEVQRSGGLPPSTHTGLGWMLIKSGEQLIAWHPGRTGGYRSFLGYNPSARIGVVALADASTETGLDDIALHLLDSRFPLAKPRPARQHHVVTVDPSNLDRYVGRYRVSPALTLEVTRDADRLFLQATGQTKQELFAEGEGEFFLKSTDAQVSFESSGPGQVEVLILHHGGWDRRGVRVQ